MQNSWDNGAGSPSHLKVWRALPQADTSHPTPRKHRRSHLLGRGEQKPFLDGVPTILTMCSVPASRQGWRQSERGGSCPCLVKGPRSGVSHSGLQPQTREHGEKRLPWGHRPSTLLSQDPGLPPGSWVSSVFSPCDAPRDPSGGPVRLSPWPSHAARGVPPCFRTLRSRVWPLT